jgi:hypothetical protein
MPTNATDADTQVPPREIPTMPLLQFPSTNLSPPSTTDMWDPSSRVIFNLEHTSMPPISCRQCSLPKADEPLPMVGGPLPMDGAPSHGRRPHLPWPPPQLPMAGGPLPMDGAPSHGRRPHLPMAGTPLPWAPPQLPMPGAPSHGRHAIPWPSPASCALPRPLPHLPMAGAHSMAGDPQSVAGARQK